MAIGPRNAEQLAELAGLRAYLAELPDSEAKRAIESESVLKMILRGWTYGAVAAALGIPKTTCHRRVQTALADRTNPLVDKHREVASARLDVMTAALAAIVDSSTAAHSDRIAAVRAWTAVEARRAALLGTDAPTNANVRLTVEEDQDQQLEAMIAATREQLLRERVNEPRELGP